MEIRTTAISLYIAGAILTMFMVAKEPDVQFKNALIVTSGVVWPVYPVLLTVGWLFKKGTP